MKHLIEEINSLSPSQKFIKTRAAKKLAGVTLLEIMLVLAIAAMVIVMSIRYYQSASSSQRINTAMNTITAVVAASENYLNAKGSFSGMTNSGLAPYLPGANSLFSPWGGGRLRSPLKILLLL